MNERLKKEKEKAMQWAINMGMLPRITAYGKAIWETNFINKHNESCSRKKMLRKNKYNSHAFLHKPTNGLAVTKKVIKERKDHSVKVTKHKPSDYREVPNHYKDLVNRDYIKRTKEKA